MKMLQNLAKASLIVLVIVISINFTGCKKTQELVSQESKSKIEQVDQFLNELKKLREDSEKSKEYFEIMDKLSVLVKEEVKRNPERMESFLEDMISIAVKAGPGLALQVEDYANTSLKQETERLKKESVELKKRVNKFQKEYNDLSQFNQLRREKVDKSDKMLGLIQDKMRISTKMVRIIMEMIGNLRKITNPFELRRQINDIIDDLEFLADQLEYDVGELEDIARDLDFAKELNEQQQLKD